MLALLFNSAPIGSDLIPFLESKNYEVQVGETWLECWQLYQQALPELIVVVAEETILDELTQLLKQIRSYPEGEHAVIVAFALAKNLVLVETLITQGLDDFLLLPWHGQSLGLKLTLYHKLYRDRAPLQRVVNNLLTEDNNQNLLSAKADTHSSDEYIILDHQLKVVTCSPQADRFSDEQQPIEPGEPIQDYFPELFGVEDILHSVCDGKQMVYRLPGIARSLHHPDDLYVDLEITPQPHPQDHTPGLLMVLRDTSQLMELKQIVMQRSNESQLLLRQLTINQTYLDRVINSMADALFVTTPKGIIKTANPAVSCLLGYEVKELINQPIAKFIKNEQFLRSLTDQGNTTPQQLVCQTQDGRKLIIAFSKSTIPGEQQENIVYIGRDITRQIVYLHRIKTLNQSLKQKTEELEQVNTELEAFSRTVSHDLRGPLSHISLFNQLMMAEYGPQLDDQGRDYMAEIREGCHRMNQLISDLLQLSRAKFQELDLDLIDLSNLGEDILFRLQRKDRDRPVQIRIQPSMEVVGDYGLIKVVLENLLNNAWKYTGKETVPKIHLGIVSHMNHSFEQVKLLAQSQPGKIYFVRDNGAGFDMAKAEDLFTPFKRLHSQEEFEGTGVGLATVKRIIERHQGTIWAESIPGQGTTFYYTLNCSL